MESPFPEDLAKIADSMGIALYQRFTVSEAALFLRCPIKDVEAIRASGRIEYIQVTASQVEFFGYQLLQYLLSKVAGSTSPPVQESSSDRILRAKEVQSMTGLSRTTLWRLERKGNFPARVPLSSSIVGWRLNDVEEWIRER